MDGAQRNAPSRGSWNLYILGEAGIDKRWLCLEVDDFIRTSANTPGFFGVPKGYKIKISLGFRTNDGVIGKIDRLQRTEQNPTGLEPSMYIVRCYWFEHATVEIEWMRRYQYGSRDRLG